MGLFSFLKKKKRGDYHDESQSPELSRSMFVEEQDPLENMEVKPADQGKKGIEELYAFLQKDYESKGYNDALTNPDERYRIDNINLLKHDLTILIQKVSTYYEDLLKEIDFHILTRGRAGLVDLVEVLKTRRELVEEHMKKVSQISSEMEQENGVSQRIFLSYQRGFIKGLSAITLANVLNKEI